MKVLIPVDHPSPTQLILERCRRFADVGSCTIVLAHVTPPDESADPSDMNAYLVEPTRVLREGGMDAMYVLGEGEPQVEIGRLAHELDAYLLIPA